MLKSGFLASNSVMVSTSHSDEILKKYEKVLDKCFQKISYFEKNKINGLKNLKLASNGFYRLN